MRCLLLSLIEPISRGGSYVCAEPKFFKRIFLFVAILGVGFSSYSQISQRPQNSNATPAWAQLYKGKERVNQPGWAEGYCNQTMLYRLTQRKDSRWMDVEKFSKVVENNKGVRSKVLPGITNCDKRLGGNYSNVSFEACMINEERLSQYQFGFMVGWLEASQFLNGPQDPAQLPNHERASAGCMSLLP